MERVSTAVQHERQVFDRLAFVDPILAFVINPEGGGAFRFRLVNKTFNESITHYQKGFWSKLVERLVHSGALVARLLAQLPPSNEGDGDEDDEAPGKPMQFFGAFILERILRRASGEGLAAYNRVNFKVGGSPWSLRLVQQLCVMGNTAALRTLKAANPECFKRALLDGGNNGVLQQRRDVRDGGGVLAGAANGCEVGNSGNAEVARKYVAAAARSAECFDSRGGDLSPLMAAIVSGSLPTLAFLMDENDGEIPTSALDWRAVEAAAIGGSVPFVAEILCRRNPALWQRAEDALTTKELHDNVLHPAVACNHIELVELLLDASEAASENGGGGHGNPFPLALRQLARSALSSFHGNNVHLVHVAIVSAGVEMMALLLDAGTAELLNARSPNLNDGRASACYPTPLMTAVAYRRMTCVRELLERGADVHATSVVSGAGVMDYALVLEDEPLVRLLHRYGARPLRRPLTVFDNKKDLLDFPKRFDYERDVGSVWSCARCSVQHRHHHAGRLLRIGGGGRDGFLALKPTFACVLSDADRGRSSVLRGKTEEGQEKLFFGRF